MYIKVCIQIDILQITSRFLGWRPPATVPDDIPCVTSLYRAGNNKKLICKTTAQNRYNMMRQRLRKTC